MIELIWCKNFSKILVLSRFSAIFLLNTFMNTAPGTIYLYIAILSSPHRRMLSDFLWKKKHWKLAKTAHYMHRHFMNATKSYILYVIIIWVHLEWSSLYIIIQKWPKPSGSSWNTSIVLVVIFVIRYEAVCPCIRNVLSVYCNPLWGCVSLHS